jgi:ParB/RepB/Spo0J family partition protein
MSKVAVTFGRGNPPTAGHKKLADKVKEIADKEGASYELHWSHSQDTKKNPLDHKTKVSFMKKLMPSHRAAIKSEDSVRDPISLMKHLESKGHKEVHVVVGSDRVEGMKKLLNAYNGKEYNFDKIHVHSAGTRDPDAEGVTGISASKMRQHALNDDHGSFHKGLPEGTPHKTSKQLFNAVRKGLKINESHICEDENKIEMSTDPDNFGATVNGDFKHIPTTKIKTSRLQGFEPPDKMKQEGSKQNLAKLVKHIKSGGDVPPILVRKHPSNPLKLQIIDGHHRYHAHIKAGVDTIPAKIIPPKHITVVGKEDNMNKSKPEKSEVDVPHFSDPLSVKHERAQELKKQVDDIQKQIKEESYVDVVIKNAEELVERMTIQTLPIFFTEEEMFGDAVEILDEALSRQERIRRGMNLRKRRAMIQQKRKLKMRRMPSQEEAKRRARKMAIKILKQKFSGGKKMHELSVADKMRLEKLLTVRKGAVERIAIRLVKKVRDLARSRISSSSAVGKANHPTGVGPVTVKTNKQMVKVREGEEQFDEANKSDEEMFNHHREKELHYKNKYQNTLSDTVYNSAREQYHKHQAKRMEYETKLNLKKLREDEQLDEYDRIEAYMRRQEQGGKSNAQHYNDLATVGTKRQQDRNKKIKAARNKKIQTRKRAIRAHRAKILGIRKAMIKEDGMDSNSSGNDATDNRTTSFADKPTALPRNPNEPSGKGDPKKKGEQEVKLGSKDVLVINPIVS